MSHQNGNYNGFGGIFNLTYMGEKISVFADQQKKLTVFMKLNSVGKQFPKVNQMTFFLEKKKKKRL